MLPINILYTIPLLLAAGISISVAIYAWRERTPVAGPLTLLLFAVAEWSLCYAFELVSIDLAGKLLWAKIKYLGIVCTTLGWLIFTAAGFG